MKIGLKGLLLKELKLVPLFIRLMTPNGAIYGNRSLVAGGSRSRYAIIFISYKTCLSGL